MKELKIKIAQYKNSKSFFGGLIRFKQKWIQKLPGRNARFSHDEIVFPFYNDKDILERLKRIENIYAGKHLKSGISDRFRKEHFEKNNLWFSSSETDGGTRFKFISDNNNNWVFKEINVTKKEYLKVLDFCISQNNNSYNWSGIFFKQTLGVDWFRKKGDWFCSQITLAGLQQICLFCGVDAIDINPGELSYMLDNNL